MQREPEFGKIISNLSPFCFYESPSYFYENVNSVRCTVYYQLVAQCFYLILLLQHVSAIFRELASLSTNTFSVFPYVKEMDLCVYCM